MDNRFPKYLRTICKKLSFISVPNLGMLLAGLAILGFIGHNFLNISMIQFSLNPHKILQGEVWRLVTFPVTEAPGGPIWLLFYCFYVYFVMNAMEAQWGAGTLTLFTLFAYLCGIAGSFYLYSYIPAMLWLPVPTWKYFLENITLAFGTLFPDIELSLFGIIPIKAKYIAYLAAAFVLFDFVRGNYIGKIYILIALLPYLLWFTPVLYRNIIDRRNTAVRRKKFDSDMWK